MPPKAVETIAIHNPEDKKHRVLINMEDYDPDEHKLWDKNPEMEQTARIEKEHEEKQDAFAEAEAEDLVKDREGKITHVYVVNPNDKRARTQMPADKYVPGTHTLWSQRNQ